MWSDPRTSKNDISAHRPTIQGLDRPALFQYWLTSCVVVMVAGFEEGLGRRAVYFALFVTVHLSLGFSITYGRPKVSGLALLSNRFVTLSDAFTLISAHDLAFLWGSLRDPILCFQQHQWLCFEKSNQSLLPRRSSEPFGLFVAFLK